jgi:8-oxo-dGTP diphosphatase
MGPAMSDDRKPAVTTDVAVVAPAGDGCRVLLIKRANQPFAGRWALPGGFLEPLELLEHCARRELREETGLVVSALEQLGAYDTPGRDPRGWIISVVYIARVTEELPLAGADDAADARWFAIGELPRLAFDHDRVLADVRERLG